MQTKRIKCPNCGVILEVRNSQNEHTKQITCPRCKAVLQVSFNEPPQQAPLHAYAFNDGETQLGAYGSTNNGETQLVNQPAADTAQKKNGWRIQPFLRHEGRDYPLLEGHNTIGRRGTTSQASVQIATDDRYMSRQHCTIDVTFLPDATVKAVLSNYQNKNQTVVEGTIMEAGDSIRLTTGNSIRMGHTTVTYHGKE